MLSVEIHRRFNFQAAEFISKMLLMGLLLIHLMVFREHLVIIIECIISLCLITNW